MERFIHLFAYRSIFSFYTINKFISMKLNTLINTLQDQRIVLCRTRQTLGKINVLSEELEAAIVNSVNTLNDVLNHIYGKIDYKHLDSKYEPNAKDKKSFYFRGSIIIKPDHISKDHFEAYINSLKASEISILLKTEVILNEIPDGSIGRNRIMNENDNTFLDLGDDYRELRLAMLESIAEVIDLQKDYSEEEESTEEESTEEESTEEESTEEESTEEESTEEESTEEESTEEESTEEESTEEESTEEESTEEESTEEESAEEESTEEESTEEESAEEESTEE